MSLTRARVSCGSMITLHVIMSTKEKQPDSSNKNIHTKVQCTHNTRIEYITLHSPRRARPRGDESVQCVHTCIDIESVHICVHIIYKSVRSSQGAHVRSRYVCVIVPKLCVWGFIKHQQMTRARACNLLKNCTVQHFNGQLLQFSVLLRCYLLLI